MVVDGASPAEVVVVLGHRQKPLARDVAAAQYVFEEREHFRGGLGAAERNDQDGVVGHPLRMP